LSDSGRKIHRAESASINTRSAVQKDNFVDGAIVRQIIEEDQHEEMRSVLVEHETDEIKMPS